MQTLSGRTLGRYHLLEPLGEGGMAAVYRAHDTRLEREVAIKVIRTDFDRDPAFLKRFEREARALAQLTHPHIVHVLDAGEQDGTPYVVMDYVAGGTLKALTGRPLPAAEAARLVVPIARALDHAHRQGIVHRDVKPANILLTPDGRPMLSDFGIAKVLSGPALTQLTGTGIGIGTPDYMAPEQWTHEATPASDVYALGVVLYELVAGRRPYQADTPVAVLLKHANDPLPSARHIVPGLPPAVEQVLVKALAKKPEDRYGTMGAFADALEQAVQTATAPRRPGLWPWLLGLGAAAVVAGLLVVTTGVVLWRLTSATPTAVSAAVDTELPAEPAATSPQQAATASLEPLPATAVPASTPVPATPSPVPTRAVSDGGGGLIAFYSNASGSNDIYIMNADGTNLRQLTADEGDSRLPAWSRDGQRLVYQSSVNGVYQIMMLTLVSGQTTQITQDACNHFNPVWSGHGRLAFYSDCDGNREIYTTGADGTGTVQLTFTDDVYNWFPFWSPDDTRITFSSNREGAKYQIFVMNADGTNPVPLARGCVSAFSPDGTRIVYSSYCDGTGDILVMNAQGGNVVNLTNGVGENANPSWSRDGTRIVFQSKRDGGTNIYVADPDGENLQALTQGPGLRAAPVWQP